MCMCQAYFKADDEIVSMKCCVTIKGEMTKEHVRCRLGIGKYEIIL